MHAFAIEHAGQCMHLVFSMLGSEYISLQIRLSMLRQCLLVKLDRVFRMVHVLAEHARQVHVSTALISLSVLGSACVSSSYYNGHPGQCMYLMFIID